MKIGTCTYQNRQHIFVAVDEFVVLPALIDKNYPYADLIDLIRNRDPGLGELGEVVAHGGGKLPLAQVDLLAPIPRPAQNVMCLGWNYAEHINEAKSDLPEHPIVFTKSVTSVIGPGHPIPFEPDVCGQLDWEVELGVIIGKPGRGIRKEDAYDHVFGYTIINDISARDLQFKHQQFFLGKSIDGGCPMGPWIATRNEIRDPQDLNLRCAVNGVIKQDSNTRHMIFDIATTIETLSRGMMLEAGDIIATGTPEGVGFTRKPPEFLKPGDTVVCEIEGIGSISNSIVAPGL